MAGGIRWIHRLPAVHDREFSSGVRLKDPASAVQPYRQPPHAVAHEGRVSLQFGLGDGEIEAGEAREELLQRGNAFHPGQRGAHAVVRAMAQ